jgi:predicted dehydrogenase
LADSREGGEQIVSSWRQAGTVGMVGFNYRFNSVIQDLRKALAREEVGPVVAVHSYFGLAVTDLPAWKRERATGGGALLDLASHHIDLLRFLLQTEVRAVDCQIWSDRTEDDNAMLTLTLESGIVAQLHASLSSVEEDRIEILGRNGKLIYDRYYSERLQRTGKSPGRVRRQLLLNRIASFVPGSDLRDKLRSPLREPSFPRSLAQFLEAITTGESRPPSIEDGWQCLRVILAAEEAHRLQRTQTLNS